MEVRIWIIVSAILYSFGYLVLAIYTFGGGYGTILFASALPTWILFLASVVLLFWSGNSEIRKAILVLMALNYLVTGAIVAYSFFGTVLYNLNRDRRWYSFAFNADASLLVLGIACYLVGQGVFWLFYFRRTGTTGRLP